MNKKIGILVTLLLMVAVFAACGEEVAPEPAESNVIAMKELPSATDDTSETPEASGEPRVAGAAISLLATDASGAEAVPVAFDVYNQVMALFSAEIGGYDADFTMDMVMNMEMDGIPAGVTTSVSSGNMRINIDGDLVQSATIMDTVMIMEMEGISETISMNMEMYMEMYGTSINFMQIIIDGEEFNDPLMAEMFDAIPDINIPDIDLYAILYADIAAVGDEVHVSLVLDATMLSDFVDELLGDLMGDMLAMLGMDFGMEIGQLEYLLVIDNNGNLASMEMYMNMFMSMEMDLGFEVVDFSLDASISTVYYYNYIGNVEITMPSR
ncbi:MAG: hypothetical protein FWF81_12125 [Defluviitaleaceae bacterium]|nr:hypothetical protein [Defluviitaleaceae bacterium]